MEKGYQVVDGVGYIPEGTEEVVNYAFEHSEELREIDIPDSVKNIGMAAFVKCKKLTRVTFPNSLKEEE